MLEKKGGCKLYINKPSKSDMAKKGALNFHNTDYNSCQSNSIERLALISKMRIEHAIKLYGVDRCAVACSFGKDSIVVLRIALDVNSNIPVVWCDTKCESKHTYEFANKIIRDWDLNIHIARAPKGVNFWTIAKEYGLPEIRGKGNNRVPKCCQILKDGPAEEMYSSLGTKCVMTGITAEESHQRFMLMQRNANKAQSEGVPADDIEGYGCGAKYFSKTKNRYTLMPIVDWTVSDVWNFHNLRSISHCKVYDLCKDGRVGCGPCTAYNSWIVRMPQQDPESYAKIRKIIGITTIEDYTMSEVHL